MGSVCEKVSEFDQKNLPSLLRIYGEWLMIEFTRVPVVAPAGTAPGYRLCEAPSQPARDRTFNAGWREVNI